MEINTKLPALSRYPFRSPALINEWFLEFEACSINADLPKSLYQTGYSQESPGNETGKSQQVSKGRKRGRPNP